MPPPSSDTALSLDLSGSSAWAAWEEVRRGRSGVPAPTDVMVPTTRWARAAGDVLQEWYTGGRRGTSVHSNESFLDVLCGGAPSDEEAHCLAAYFGWWARADSFLCLALVGVVDALVAQAGSLMVDEAADGVDLGPGLMWRPMNLTARLHCVRALHAAQAVGSRRLIWTERLLPPEKAQSRLEAVLMGLTEGGAGAPRLWGHPHALHPYLTRAAREVGHSVAALVVCRADDGGAVMGALARVVVVGADRVAGAREAGYAAVRDRALALLDASALRRVCGRSDADTPEDLRTPPVPEVGTVGRRAPERRM